MTAQIGIGRSYRAPSRLERLGSRLRSAVSGTVFHSPLRTVFRTALGWLAGDRLVATLPGGERVRMLPEHRQLAWNAEEYAAFKAVVAPGDTVLDVGANLGAYTVLFAQWVGPGGRVFAFEPALESRSGLNRQLELNRVADRVRVCPEAVAATSGTRLFEAEGLRGDNRLAPLHGPASAAVCTSVPTTSIDEFCEQAGIEPHVLKIDVEGAELEVLRGARRTIARLGSHLAVFVELHPHVWGPSGISRREVEAELTAQGLAIERIDGGDDPWAVEGVCVRVRQRCAF